MSALIHVAVAIIINQKNQVLISLRPAGVHQGGLWEFPGGKLEDGESALDALKREIDEELGISIDKASSFKKITYQYPDKKVLLDIWKVESYSGEPQGAEGQQLKWRLISDLNAKEFPTANREIIQTLKLPERYMITGSFENTEDFKLKLENSLKSGISLVQLRCKNTSVTEYKHLVKMSTLLCELHGAILLLNTTLDVFLDTNANGLHLSSQMLHSIQQRPIDKESLLSVSCHTEQEIEKAKQLEADIILLSPVRETKSHPGVEGIGWEKFAQISSNVEVPVYALGGMAESDICDAKSSGAQGVAAISSFWKS
ncbi:MAG: hypothetical protein DIZ80_14575 [endosymbiont of Galathealinum brachiosum]|uniref:8-oxo-dGTP diphosphatase n=1 Tax=endosymbiont of Galathealinum brachiosum TaxID=2200906 RepID=A0A370D8W5_9GAMM|nr:MAG: hypothetical protein DIZ80_14575 [endosymbiont of Galathealinum brachiosum]